MTKKILAVILALAMVLSLTACVGPAKYTKATFGGTESINFSIDESAEKEQELDKDFLVLAVKNVEGKLRLDLKENVDDDCIAYLYIADKAHVDSFADKLMGLECMNIKHSCLSDFTDLAETVDLEQLFAKIRGQKVEPKVEQPVAESLAETKITLDGIDGQCDFYYKEEGAAQSIATFIDATIPAETRVGTFFKGFFNWLLKIDAVADGLNKFVEEVVEKSVPEQVQTVLSAKDVLNGVMIARVETENKSLVVIVPNVKDAMEATRTTIESFGKLDLKAFGSFLGNLKKIDLKEFFTELVKR